MIIYIEYTDGCQEFDLSPFNRVYNLRRLLAEDHRVMEEHLYVYRGGVEINDETELFPNDVVQISIEYLASKKRKIKA